MKKTALTIIGWVISLALIAFLATRLNFPEIWRGFLNARWSYLAAAAIVNFGVIALKALRWQWLMRPEKRVNYGDIFRATMIGLAGNNVMPARGGDWFKIYLLGKREGVSKAALASIAGLDKLFDGLAILILFGALSFHSNFPVWVQRGTVIVSVVIAVSLVICILLFLHHRRNPADETREPGAISRFAKKLGSGMSALGSPKLIAAVLANSVLNCLLQVSTIWLCQLAFNQHLDIWVPALVYVAINLAITIPSAPSGVGPFEVAAVVAYRWLGISTAAAFNIALMYHAVQFFPVTIIGFIFYVRALSGRTLSKREEACVERGA